METVPATVSLGAAITVMLTMFAMLAIFRFHTRNFRGRSRLMRRSAEQGTEMYQHLLALEIMRVLEEFEADEREHHVCLGEIAIDLTSQTEVTYSSHEEPAQSSNYEITRAES